MLYVLARFRVVEVLHNKFSCNTCTGTCALPDMYTLQHFAYILGNALQHVLLIFPYALGHGRKINILTLIEDTFIITGYEINIIYCNIDYLLSSIRV